nr:hypothetical protein [Tanacetum cinerariifolium]
YITRFTMEEDTSQESGKSLAMLMEILSLMLLATQIGSKIPHPACQPRIQRPVLTGCVRLIKLILSRILVKKQVVKSKVDIRNLEYITRFTMEEDTSQESGKSLAMLMEILSLML